MKSFKSEREREKEKRTTKASEAVAAARVWTTAPEE